MRGVQKTCTSDSFVHNGFPAAGSYGGIAGTMPWRSWQNGQGNVPPAYQYIWGGEIRHAYIPGNQVGSRINILNDMRSYDSRILIDPHIHENPNASYDGGVHAQESGYEIGLNCKNCKYTYDYATEWSPHQSSA